MPRMKLTLEYDGSGFSGFQRQAGTTRRTVQGVLEERLSLLLNEPVTVHASGRTDAGVHALAQVAHVDISRSVAAERLRYALSRQLPADLSVREVVAVGEGFHARKSAIGKHYSYHLYNGRPAHAIGHQYLSYEPQPIDIDLLRQVLLPLIGHHNFRGFCGRGATVQTFERTLYVAEVQAEDDWFSFHFIGDGFLRKMVRNIVGSALDVATGRKAADIVLRALASGERSDAGTTAAAEGLYLERVYYEQEDFDKAKNGDFRRLLVGGPARAFVER